MLAVKNYVDDNTPNAHVYIAAYPKKNPCIVSDYGVTELMTVADFNTLAAVLNGRITHGISLRLEGGQIKAFINDTYAGVVNLV